MQEKNTSLNKLDIPHNHNIKKKSEEYVQGGPPVMFGLQPR
jgi:hypothetical protein